MVCFYLSLFLWYYGVLWFMFFLILWYSSYFYHFIYGFAHLWFNKYWYIFKKDLSRFSNTKAFVSLVYAANFVRDVFSTGLEIVLNTILIYLLKKYYYDNVLYTGRPNEVFSKTEKTNTIITIVISTLSILMHIVTFLVKPLFLLTFDFGFNDSNNSFRFFCAINYQFQTIFFQLYWY